MSQDNNFIGEVRYSRDMRLFRAITLGLGVSLGVGIFLLLGPVAQWAGTNAPLAYLVTGVLFLPIVLSLAELAVASEPGGVYHIIRAPEHELLTYLTSWSLLGGGIALSGLLARGSAEYLSALSTNLLNVHLDPRWLAPAFALLLTANNILGTRENKWMQNAIILVGLATLLAFSGWLWLGSPSTPPVSGQILRSNTTAATALLSGSLWGLMLILAAGEEMRQAQKDTPRTLFAVLAMGSIIGSVVAAASLHKLGSATTEHALFLANLTAHLGGPILQGWILTIGVIILATTLNRALLTFARIAADVSRGGFLPSSWRATHPQFRTPYRLLAAGGILAALASLHSDVTFVAVLASIGLLSAIALVNIPTVLSLGDNLPKQRPIVLPFAPLIPGLAIAISLFLLTAFPVTLLAIGAGWFVVGAALYIGYGRRGVVAARTGVTVFRGEPAARAEATYRVLVPLANPVTAEALISTGSALARAHDGGEVIALQVVVVPEQTSLLAGRRTARQRWSLLDQAMKRAHAAGVPVHPVVRIAHSPVEGILDTANEENCDLILLGWHVEPNTQTYELGPVIDPVVTQAACDVAVLKGELPDQLERILIPTAGGPHAPAAVQIGLDLATEPKTEVIALNLIRGPVTAPAREQAQAKMSQTMASIKDAGRVSQRIARGDDVKQSILEAADRCDLLLLGASEEGLLDQIKFGGLPEEIARDSRIPVILVKRHRGLPQFWLRQVWRSLYALFPSLDRSEQIEVYRNMRRGARPDVDFFVLIILSSIIATLGLLQNSAAVIIGAMLVAPLMTPMLAMSLGIVWGDVRLLRLSLEAALKGITLAVVVAVWMVLILPEAELTQEIMARIRPTLLDLIVALASGAAGAYAIGRKEVAAALPGVAIAAALVPPLCVTGTGIALSRPDVAGGAFLLFTTNLVAISLAGAVVFLLLGFRPAPDERERQRRFWQGLAVSLVLLVAISIPLGVFLIRTIRDGHRQQAISETLVQEAPSISATLVDFDVQREPGGFRVVATLYAPKPPDRNTTKNIQDEMSRAIGAPVRLELVIIPVARVPAE